MTIESNEGFVRVAARRDNHLFAWGGYSARVRVFRK
jgi:hypothetical protein